MQYGGFIVEYQVNSQIKFAGPKSTIEEIKKVYDDLALLEPVVTDRRICRLLVNPSNPSWI
jgi:hypothetical protein